MSSVASHSSSASRLNLTKFKDAKELYQHNVERAAAWQKVYDTLSKRIKSTKTNMDINLLQIPDPPVELGSGRDKTVYRAEYNGIPCAYFGTYPGMVKYSVFMSSISPNFVKVVGYDPDTLFMEHLGPIDLMSKKYTKETSQSPVLQLIFTFLSCANGLGIRGHDFIPARNWGVRIADKDEELEYPVIATLFELNKVAIKVKKGDCIPVLYDYWINYHENGSLFRTYQADPNDEYYHSHGKDDDEYKNTVLDDNIPTQGGWFISDAYAYGSRHMVNEHLDYHQIDSTIYTYTRERIGTLNELRCLVDLFEHAEEFEWLVVE